MQPLPIELLCSLHLLVFPGFIADSVGKCDPAFLTAGAIMIFGSNLMFLRKLSGRKDSSEENLALGINLLSYLFTQGNGALNAVDPGKKHRRL